MALALDNHERLGRSQVESMFLGLTSDANPHLEIGCDANPLLSQAILRDSLKLSSYMGIA